jgi:hypothetical protein
MDTELCHLPVLLLENNPDRGQVVAVIEADSIELLAKSEGSKFLSTLLPRLLIDMSV